MKKKTDVGKKRFDEEYYVDLIERLVNRLPNERRDYSGVYWCAGCGVALHNSCRIDCVLQEANKIIKR